MKNWNLQFIAEQDFIKHIQLTIAHYGDKLEPYNLDRLNRNIIDPIKLLFDKNVYNLSWEDVIRQEIFRQRDKSNNNEIGYFHQVKNMKTIKMPKDTVILEFEKVAKLQKGSFVLALYVLGFDSYIGFK